MSRLPRSCQCGQIHAAGVRCPLSLARHEATRARTTERGYGWEWQQISRQVIEEEGACRECGTDGDPSNPLTCDHILSKANGGRDERENLMCLCRRCNSRKATR